MLYRTVVRSNAYWYIAVAISPPKKFTNRLSAFSLDKSITEKVNWRRCILINVAITQEGQCLISAVSCYWVLGSLLDWTHRLDWKDFTKKGGKSERPKNPGRWQTDNSIRWRFTDGLWSENNKGNQCATTAFCVRVHNSWREEGRSSSFIIYKIPTHPFPFVRFKL